MNKIYLNIALKQNEYKLHGCPVCGCTTSISDSCYISNCGGLTCRECNTHFFIVHEEAKQENITISYSSGDKDSNGKDIMFTPIIINHPRKAIIGHKFIYPDIRPEGEGEFWNARGIGYDLSGFVKSKQAGERLLEIVKKVLNNKNPKSWLDWREYEPEWIQFKFQEEEFNLKELQKMAKQNNNILTEEILMNCVR